MAGTRRRSADAEGGRPEGSVLLVPREQLRAEIDARLDLGQELRNREIGKLSEFEAARSDYYSWNEYNTELLKRRFTTAEIAEEYSEYLGIAYSYDSLPEKIADFREDVADRLRRLTSIRDRLELIDESEAVRRQETPPDEVRAAKGRTPESIFVVHGHDGEAKLAVQGFLRQITEVPAVILHDEPNLGRTLMEKFEQVGSASGFAVAILTADDEGRAKGTEELRTRGRQNVVFEFGFFVGYLGRSHTVVLYEEGVELPSDLDGLVYIPYDSAGSWKIKLAQELKAANVAIDLNKAL